MSPDAPRRHDLAWLSRRWRDHLVAPSLPEHEDGVAAWLDGGRPAVVRRAAPGEADGLPLGIALPPRGGPRLALVVAPAAVLRLERPAALAAALDAAPGAWRRGLRDLDREARAAGITLRVCGSLAWQHLTREAYLGPGSDVDLLLEPRRRDELARGVALLAARAAWTDPRLDGEVLFPGGAGVSWRELLAGRSRVLVRSASAVTLASAPALLDALPGAA